MKTIWKYEIKISDSIEIEMPVGAKILSVQMQVHKTFMWALVNTESKLESRLFKIAGTGNQFDIDTYRYEFIGTVQQQNFVWHIFELFL